MNRNNTISFQLVCNRYRCYMQHGRRNRSQYVQQLNAIKHAQQNTNCVWKLQWRLINHINNYLIRFPASRVIRQMLRPQMCQRQHDQLLRPSETLSIGDRQSTCTARNVALINSKHTEHVECRICTDASLRFRGRLSSGLFKWILKAPCQNC